MAKDKRGIDWSLSGEALLTNIAEVHEKENEEIKRQSHLADFEFFKYFIGTFGNEPDHMKLEDFVDILDSKEFERYATKLKKTATPPTLDVIDTTAVEVVIPESQTPPAEPQVAETVEEPVVVDSASTVQASPVNQDETEKILEAIMKMSPEQIKAIGEVILGASKSFL